VPDSENHRVQVFRADGTYVSGWGSAGAANGQFNHPTVVAVHPTAGVFVDDKDNSRIQRFASLATPTRSVTWGRLKARYR
jgi:hypothetical protein